MIQKLCMALGVLGLLAGCATATEEGYRQKVGLMVGRASADVEAEWGLPYGKAILTDGAKLWAYRRGYVVRTDEAWRTDENSGKDKWKDKDGNEHVRHWWHSQTNYTPPSASWRHCETRFVITTDGHVRDVRFDGNDCLAEEQGKPSRTLPGGNGEAQQ